MEVPKLEPRDGSRRLKNLMPYPQTSAETPKPKFESIHFEIFDVRKRSKRFPFFQYVSICRKTLCLFRLNTVKYPYGPDVSPEDCYDQHGPFWSMHKLESVIGILLILPTS